MIQRIQSLYFFFAAVCIGILAFAPLYSAEYQDIKYDVFIGGLLKSKGGTEEVISSNPALFAVVILLLLMPLIAIFLFNNRKLQLRIGSSAMLSYTIFVFVLAALVNESMKLAPEISTQGHYNWGLALPFAGVILLFLANRAIKKDEALIRSADRLR
jgi:glucan phosphoethanolaminetransferase (alkaline phosphatase superfamily)